MNRIELLQTRRKKLLEAGEKIRAKIAELTDDQSFVELSSYSFSRNEFYGEDAEGEGVVTGYATVDGYPYYVVAQNYDVMNGGLSLAACNKICKCLDAAETNGTPVIYVLNSLGVQIGEGVNVLEGIASVLLRATRLKGVVPQFAIVDGPVYGQEAALCGIVDFNIFVKDAVLAANSPLVIAAKSGKNVPAIEVGGAKALDKANLATFTVNTVAEAKDVIVKITDLIATPEVDSAEMNKTLAQLNTKVSNENLEKVFDQGTAVVVGGSYCPEAKCVLGRIGGYAVASVVFDTQKNVELTVELVKKLRDFAEFASCYNLPYVTFASNGGIVPSMSVNNSLVLKAIGEYLSIFDTLSNGKVAVVSKAAIGLGYTLFASKSIGYDVTIAFADASVALFDNEVGAEVEFADVKADKSALAEKYAEECADPFNAARGGYIDAIIEPQFVKQNVVSALQMLVK